MPPAGFTSRNTGFGATGSRAVPLDATPVGAASSLPRRAGEVPHPGSASSLPQGAANIASCLSPGSGGPWEQHPPSRSADNGVRARLGACAGLRGASAAAPAAPGSGCALPARGEPLGAFLLLFWAAWDAPCHGYGRKQGRYSPVIYIPRPPAPPLLKGCEAEGRGFMGHAVYTAADGAEPRGMGSLEGETPSPCPLELRSGSFGPNPEFPAVAQLAGTARAL